VKQNYDREKSVEYAGAKSVEYAGAKSVEYAGAVESAVRTAHSIGIEVHGGRAIVLIPAGSRTPVARAMTFTTVADGQRAVEVRVVRCTAEPPRPAGVVGRFLVPGLRTGVRGAARIDIGISLDRQGVIRAWGVDRSTGARQEATFAGLWALPPRARPQALSALARRVDSELARPEFESRPSLRDERSLVSVHAGPGADGEVLAALAGEIDSIRRSTADPPVRI
jgi:molecular chaperone DnaK (HSP70)